MTGWTRRLSGRLPRSLQHVVVVHQDSDAVRARRRRVVTGTSVLGTALLGASFSRRPGSRGFYGLTVATASAWTVGGLLSGPLHLGWLETRDATVRRPVAVPVATGLGAFGFFYACARAARTVPPLENAIGRVLTFAEEGDETFVLLTTLANGIGEEVFFRGALYSALPRERAVLASTAVYTAATVATRNPALVLAATVMGGLFGLQRRATGGLQAPLLTHLTWSALMVRYLPPLFRHARRSKP